MTRSGPGSTPPLVSPLYQSAVYTLADLDHVDRIYGKEEPGFIYARDNHPNAAELATTVAALEGGAWGIVGGSGMSVLSIAFLGLVSAGDRVIAGNQLYGRTNRLLRHELARFGVGCAVVDCTDLGAVREALRTPSKFLVTETITNPLLRVADLEALAELCRAAGCRLIVDNTFASPVLCKPLEIGTDIVMESLTKIISGHSDVTLGAIAGNDMAQYPNLMQIMSIWGFSANPFDCWLAIRGIETLTLRMRAASDNARQLAEWLQTQPNVKRVIYPGLDDHPDRAAAEKILPRGCGHMLCFELANREAVNHFMRSVPEVPFAPSLGHTGTTCSHPDTTSHRYEAVEDKLRQGITPGLVRLSVGCEDFAELRTKMSRGI